MPEDRASRTNPFPGLRPFQTEEKYLFFGREQQTGELLDRLAETRFLAVVGTSGSGKSSLVRAGLLPELHGGTMVKAGSSWEVVVMRPGGDPIENLARALAETAPYDLDEENLVPQLVATLNRSRLGLVEAVRQSEIETETNLLLVVDQFEEVFRFHQQACPGEEQATDFVNLLLEAAAQDHVSIYIALTMRSDFLGDCSQFPGLAEAVNGGEYLIPRMNRDQSWLAIEGPVKVGGGMISPRLVQRLVNEIGDNPDQLPVLQHALMRTWNQWAKSESQIRDPESEGGPRPLDLADYEGVGGIDEALSRHSDEVYQALPDDRHRLVAEHLFKSLTEGGADNRGMRRPTRLNQLAEIAGASLSEVITVVEAFRKKDCTFLMPMEPTPLKGETVVDISHESLMRVWHRLDQWVEEEAQSARIYRRLADTAQLHREGKAGLYHDPDLQIAVTWREQSHPNPVWADRYYAGFETAIQFLGASNHAKQAEIEERETARQRELEQAKALAETGRRRGEEQALHAQRLRWLVRGLGIVSAVVLLAFAFAWFARREAQRNEEFANEQRQMAVGAQERALAAEQSARQNQYFTTVPYAASLLERSRFAEARSLLLDAPEELRHWEWGYLFNAANPEALDLTQGTLPIRQVRVSPDGKQLAAAITGTGVSLWDLESGQLKLEIPIPGPALSILRYSHDGGRLITVVSSYFNTPQSANIWSSTTGEKTASLEGHTAQIQSIEFTLDDSMVISSALDQSVRYWDSESGDELVERQIGSEQTRNRWTGFVDAVLSHGDQTIVRHKMTREIDIHDFASGALVKTISLSVRPTWYSRRQCRYLFASFPGPAEGTQTVQMFDAKTGDLSDTLEVKVSGGFETILANGNETHLLTIGTEGAKIYDLSSQKVPLELEDFGGNLRRWTLRTVPIFTDELVIYQVDKNELGIWDSRTGRKLGEVVPSNSWVDAQRLSPDREWLYTGSRDGSLKIWNVSGSSEIRSEIQSIPISPALRAIPIQRFAETVLTGEDEQLFVAARTAQESPFFLNLSTDGMNPLSGPDGWPASQVALNRDRSILATTHYEGPLRVWDVNTRTLIAELPPETSFPLSNPS